MTKRKRMRRVGAIDGTGHGVVIRQPVPKVKAGQLLVRVHAATISPGTELPAARAARAAGCTDPGTPRPIGYQNSGKIVEVGQKVAQFKKGDRVACFGGGFAYITDYAVVPQNLCCKLPDNVRYEDGAYGNVMLTALQAIRRGEPVLGERLLVVGMGIIGQIASQLGRLAGMDVMGWDTVAFRNRLAKKCGISATVTVGRQDAAAEAAKFTNGEGFDMAVMAFGGDGTKALSNVVQVMRESTDGHRMGRIVLVGGLTTECKWGSGQGNLDLRCSARTGPGYHDDEWEHGSREYPTTFMRWTTRTNFELMLKLIGRGDLKIKPLTTHRLPLAKIDEAVSAHIESPNKTLGTVLVID